MRAPSPSVQSAQRRCARLPAFSTIAALLLACAGAARAEYSPLSIHEEGFGLGVSPHGVREKGMGEAGMASITGQGLSIANPSRAAFHDKTSFTAIADGDVDWLRDDVTSNRFATFLIPAIGLNFNLRKYGHLGFFYRQRYHRNFSFTPLEPVRADAVQTFSTEGGLYEAAAFYAIAPVPSVAISLGYHYFLGRERLIESAVFTGDPGSEDLVQGQDLAGDTLFTRSQGGRPSISATFRRRSFSLALSGTMGVTLDQRISRSVTNLLSDGDRETSKDLPWAVSGGAAFRSGPRQTWVADFSWEGWDDDDSGLLNPAYLLGIGYEFQGRGGPYEPYLRKLAYRGGLGMERLYLEETDLYFLTAGLGMPLGRRGSLLDFAIKYGHRGSAKNNLWSEDYIKLSISLTGVGNWGQPVRKRR
jgi:long-chain fatty acid transport protein